jgi:hypothetical protein
MRFILSILFLVGSGVAVAQTPLLDQVLIPVYVPNPSPGAHGSLWQTDLLVHNPTASPIRQTMCPGWVGGIGFVHEPLSTKVPRVGWLAIPAIFDCFESRIEWSLRVRDLSRQALTWGTEIPVIREPELMEIVSLVGVPTDSRFRQTLRVYSWRAEKNPVFSVQAFAEDGSMLLERKLATVWPIDSYPGFAEVMDIVEHHPELATSERVTLRVTATTAGGPEPVWAFVSVTNNETQHVTLITPD